MGLGASLFTAAPGASCRRAGCPRSSTRIPLRTSSESAAVRASFPALVGISLLSCCLLSLQEVKATASSKMMLGWLKNSQEASPKKKENELPRWTSQFIHSPSPKKSSADILQQWLGKEGEPAAKKRKV